MNVTRPLDVYLVACTSRKALYPGSAKNIYRSPLFEGSRWLAEKRSERWFVLSAKHGLLNPDQMIDPYDESLYGLDEKQLGLWASKVFNQLKQFLHPGSRVVFLAGDRYRTHLEHYLADTKIESSAPLRELGIGSQVGWLQKVIREEKRLRQMDDLYEMLSRLSRIDDERDVPLGHRKSFDTTMKGIYFFYQAGETRLSKPFTPRVVRIGTHGVSAGSKSSLWTRLRTHRGGKDGLGNHRSSIFRLHIGQCLIRRSSLELVFPTWGVGQSASTSIRASEREIEEEVSHIVSEMRLTCLRVNDDSSPDSDRAYLERNLISLLSGPDGPIDLASRSWLGKWSDRPAIHDSGLWNVNHVREEFDPVSLEVMGQYVEMTEGSKAIRGASIAPVGWRQRRANSQVMRDQMELL
jgi:hypothetical protein